MNARIVNKPTSKVRLLLSVMILAFGTLLSMAEKPAKASLSIEHKTFDFGTLSDASKPVSHEFEFTNTGDANLVILDATADCGCTKPEYPKAPVPPGGKGRIKVTFNPSGFRGAFQKSVTIKTNGQPRKTRIHIKGAIK